MDDEMKVFAKYMMSRALASGKGLNITRYMIILCTLSRGTSLLQYMLEQEGLTKAEIDTAMLAMKGADDEIRQEFDEFRQAKKNWQARGR